MSELVTNHNIEIPVSADPYQLIADIKKMGLSIGSALDAAGSATVTEDPNVPGTALIGE